jgi:DNA repair exonuclease SbcCD ATPase subunit
MESTVSIEQFREELQSWKHELSSIKEEIRHFEHQLEKMAAKKLPKELLSMVEHFQNSFICQKEVIDRLRHDLPDSGGKVESIFHSSHPIYRENDTPDSHGILDDRMRMFRKIYNEIRQDFKHFRSDWM